MAKTTTKKSLKASKISKPAKAPAAKSPRVPTKPAKAAKAPVAMKRPVKAGVSMKKTRAPRAPVISKNELRDQIEKLTAANTALKAKGREAAKALKSAETRLAALEHQISQTEAKPVDVDKPTERVTLPRKTRKSKTKDQFAHEAELVKEEVDPSEPEVV